MSPIHSVHERYLRRCIELAHLARQQGNTPVGSVVILDGQLIGEGIEQLSASQLLTGHAEVLACQQAVEKTGSRILCGATLYSTAEPCFMCLYVIRQAEIAEIVYAVATPRIAAEKDCCVLGTGIEAPDAFWTCESLLGSRCRRRSLTVCYFVP